MPAEVAEVAEVVPLPSLPVPAPCGVPRLLQVCASCRPRHARHSPPDGEAVAAEVEAAEVEAEAAEVEAPKRVSVAAGAAVVRLVSAESSTSLKAEVRP